MALFKARRFAGEGNANRTIGIQLPHIVKTFPEVEGCHLGTINIELEVPLLIARPDHRTPPIKWKTNLTDGEVFDLVRVTLHVPYTGTEHRAWLYVAHRSRHRANLRCHELIAPLIQLGDHVEYGLQLAREPIELPYRHNRLFILA